MSKNNDTGIFQLENGNWGYRLKLIHNGEKIDTSCKYDALGSPFKTKTLARQARELRKSEIRMQKDDKDDKIKETKLVEIYDNYMQNGCADKATSTIRKQKSMWENHVKLRFGDMYISQITLGDLQNYLAELYTCGDGCSANSYSYKYVEGFLKFFYLLFGCAYRHDLIDPIRYTKMFITRGTKLAMPKITQEDSEGYANIKVYNRYEIMQMDTIMQRGNCYLPFLIGYYCGLRISEVFALTFDDIDFDNNVIVVNKQMLYEDGCFCLCPVKTLTSVRTIDIPAALCERIYQEKLCHVSNWQRLEHGYRDTEVVIDKTKKKPKKIIGGNFICRKKNGELLTPNSMKYWSNEIRKELKIEFQFHSLRRTHGTMMANLNTPPVELMQRMGHKKYETTLAYYVNSNALSNLKLQSNLKELGYENAKEPQHSALGCFPALPDDWDFETHDIRSA